jgi:CRP/FNR family cyclic AMP-dependent transcriptional regulator
MKAAAVEVLSEALLAKIAHRAPSRTYLRNSIIVTEGDDTDTLYVLLAGRAKVFVADDQGHELQLHQIGPGEYFPDVTLDGGPRSASVMALQPCRCAVVKRDELSRFMCEYPDFALHVTRKLAHRVRALTSGMRDLALMDVYGRVARLLLDLAEEVDGRLMIKEKLTQKDIAQRVGASREMISRIFSDLSAGGYVRKENGSMIIVRRPPAHW